MSAADAGSESFVVRRIDIEWMDIGRVDRRRNDIRDGIGILGW